MTDNAEKASSAHHRLLHPEIRKGQDALLVERRSVIASVFIAMLIGLAYAEMFPPIRESVRTRGLQAGTLLLGFTFFFTSMRFFIGNQLHLLSDNVIKMRGDMWLFDFLVITFQTLLLCFLGGLSGVELNRQVPIDFVDLLVFLYCVDVVWILTQWLLGRLFREWRRQTIPWAWAVMNLLLVVAILGLRIVYGDMYSTWGLVSLLTLNLLAFILDIILIDHYDVI